MKISGVPHKFWPADTVKKIVVMSGTFNALELKKLGLHTKRICTFPAYSPIPVKSRPFMYLKTANMGYKYQDLSIPLVIEKIKELATKHSKEKGIIHLTYAMQEKFKEALGDDDRYIFHDKLDKKKKYREFRDAEGPKILMASGMSEGVDLPYDAGRWQVIPKVMYPSLADGLMKKYMKEDSEWYSWMTVRTLVQQTGRICRTPTDYGVTYMLDTSFKNLLKYNRDLFPDYFLESIQIAEQP